MVTFNRLESTKQSIASYLETVTVPWTMTIVDNGSTDGTREWLLSYHDPSSPGHFGARSMFLPRNMYPGYATNRGWEDAPEDATFLQRADNDWSFLPGWCDQVARAFKDPKVGQVGLRTQREEPVIYNVGGNNVIRRELWDKGLRYDERPWTEMDAGCSEDTYMGPAVKALGYQWTRVKQPCIVGNSTNETVENDYYRRSWGARRIYGLTPFPEDVT
jgi:glycosyltransferase involved in cell wall biosynthesis